MLLLLVLSFIATFTSQTAMDIFVGLMCIGLGVQAFRKKGPDDWKLFKKIGIEYFWLIWLLVIAIGFIANGYYGAPLFSKLWSFRWILILYFTTAAYSYVKLDLKRTINAIFYIALLLSVISLFIFIAKGEERVGGLLKNPMTFAHSHSLLFLTLSGVFLMMWRNLWFENKKKFFFWLVILALLGVTLILTMTRGVWLGLFVGVAVMAALISLRTAATIMGIGAFLLAILFFYWTKFHDRVLFALNYQHNYDNERLVLWKTNWIIVKDHPFFGTGYGMNNELLPQYYAAQGIPLTQFMGHAHNQFLQILAGSGMFGFLCFAFLFVYFLKLSWKIFKSSNATTEAKALGLGVFGALIGFLVGGLTESNFEHAKIRMVLIFLWAVLLYLKQHQESAGIKK